MFAVVCEVHPETEQWDAYLGLAKMLKPELGKIDGFIDNIRYKSLTRDGWLLSLSWDVFDAVLTPGACGARLRHVRPPRGAAILSRRQGRQDDPRPRRSSQGRFFRWPLVVECSRYI
jgi:hypothetical protein